MQSPMSRRSSRRLPMLDIRRARQKVDDVNSRALFRTGVIGVVVAALCCATPILGIALGAIGLSALATKADYVLIPVLIASLGLVVIGLYRRNASTPAV